MTDFEKRIPEDETIVEDWPDPDDYDNEEDDLDYYLEDDSPTDFEVRFKLTGATADEIDWISRYLFDVVSKHLSIPIEKFDGLEIEED